MRIVAPRRFVEEATSENVLAGIAMGRRAAYQFGTNLPARAARLRRHRPRQAPVRGTSGFALPTDVVGTTPQAMELDGVRFVFQYVPDSEAPAELTFYLPDARRRTAAPRS